MALIKPEVYTQIVSAKFKEKVKLANLAVDLGEIEGFREVGETIHFPKWKPMSNGVETVVKGTPIALDTLDQEDSTATIKFFGKGVRVFDIDDITSFGNHVQEGAIQSATLHARNFDNEIAKELQSSALKVALANANAITNAELGKAMGLYGDEIDSSEFAGIVINSRLVESFYNMAEFVDVNKSYVHENNGKQIVNGLIGYWRSIPVLVADHNTYDTTKNESITYLVKVGSVGFKTKRDFKTEVDRKAELQCNDVYTTQIYATKLLKDDGVVICRKTIA